MTRRECGCEWQIIPLAEQSERVRQAGFGNPVARFTRRCDDHDSTCRSLEPWELNLFAEMETHPMITDRAPCPEGPHRPPEGPNEDLAQCPTCWAPTYAMRPEGETYGEHPPDCSLPQHHESFCRPGGVGHAHSSKVRGYWPLDGREGL